MTVSIPFERLQAYRSETFRTLARLRLTNREQAVEYVIERGFILFWPARDLLLPSLWTAVAGDRPVPDEHDDPGHITWDWKDSMLGKRRWYYGRVVRRKNTMISLDVAPYFYALSENFGSPEEDYLIQYEQGRMTQAAKSVYETLFDKGPMDTIMLRKEAHLSNTESSTRFNRALEDLQIDFKICPVGISDAGAWHYSFMYDIVPRHFPDIPEKARFISETAAKRELVRRYLLSLGAVHPNEVKKCFRWDDHTCERAIQELAKEGFLQTEVEITGQPGEWIAITRLLNNP